MPRPNRPWWREDRGTWVSRVRGKLVTLARGRKALPEARRVLAALLAGPPAPVAGAPTLVEVAAAWGADMAARVAAGRMRELSRAQALERIKGLVERHGAAPAAGLTVAQVEAWLDAHPGWSPTTRWSTATKVRTMMRWAWRRGLLRSDPTAAMVCGTPGRREVRATAADARRWIAAVGPASLRGLLTFCFLTGCRPGEAARLTAADVDLGAGVARLHEHKTRHKTGRDRLIVMPPEAVELVRAAAVARPAGALWVNARGNPWHRTAMSRQGQAATRASGVRITCYGLRHCFASDMLISGEPVSIVAALMGHTNANVTLRQYDQTAGRLDALRAAVGRRKG